VLCPAGVVTGHHPHGDCPCVIRSGLVTVITADTSDNRGEKAVAEVLVYADGSSEVHGVLADGSNIAYTLAEDGRGDRFVGLCVLYSYKSTYTDANSRRAQVRGPATQQRLLGQSKDGRGES
jgi:hypothetical protein